MHEREFTIDTTKSDLEFFDDLDDVYAESICENELEIPSTYIKRIECFEDVFKIQLIQSKEYYRDDWYVNLTRLECVS